MNARQRHEMITRLTQLQDLRVAREQMHLVEAQHNTTAAQESAQNSRDKLDQHQDRLNHLYAAPTFCPTAYRIACETLMMAEADADEDSRLLDAAQTAEDAQRLEWHQNRQQASWLEAEAHKLGNKMARVADEKRAIEAIGMVWHRREQYQ